MKLLISCQKYLEKTFFPPASSLEFVLLYEEGEPGGESELPVSKRAVELYLRNVRGDIDLAGRDFKIRHNSWMIARST